MWIKFVLNLLFLYCCAAYLRRIYHFSGLNLCWIRRQHTSLKHTFWCSTNDILYNTITVKVSELAETF